MIRSGMGAYAGAARRRVHLATVLLRPPSAHRPGNSVGTGMNECTCMNDLTQTNFHFTEFGMDTHRSS